MIRYSVRLTEMRLRLQLLLVPLALPLQPTTKIPIRLPIFPLVLPGLQIRLASLYKSRIVPADRDRDRYRDRDSAGQAELRNPVVRLCPDVDLQVRPRH